MAKKIKVKSTTLYNIFKNINEGFFDNIDNDMQNYVNFTEYNAPPRAARTEKQTDELKQKLWNDIVNGHKKKLNSIYNPNKSVLSNDVYTISPKQMYDEMEVEVKDMATGDVHKETIPAPSEIIALCERIRETAERDKTLGLLMRRFDKPIIWTLNKGINTAASDGIRIAFNVIFAYSLIQQGKADFAALKASGTKFGSALALLTMGKYWLYVYIHEVYHELYEHMKQAERKDETAGGKNHDMANVAMDAEINRDIELLFPMFAGATEVANGVMDPNFPTEAWDDIFDAYYYNNQPMPLHELNSGSSDSDNSDMSQMGDSNSTPQQNQNQQSQQTQQSSNQQSDNLGNASSQQQSDNANNQNSDNSSSNGDQQSNEKGNANSSNGRNSSAPDTSDKSDEYNDAYNKELQNILDNMNGKKNNNADSKPQSLSDDQIDDIIELMKDALGSGMSMKDLVNNTTGNQGDGNSSIDEESARKLAEKMSQLKDLSGKTMQDAMQELSDMTLKAETETLKQAKAQALKDVADMMEDMENEMQQQSSSSDNSNNTAAGKGTSSMPTVTTSSKFGGSDMVSKEELAKIAEQEGQPYTASELTANRDLINSDYIKENIEGIKQISSALGTKVENIRNKLKDYPVITNWKTKLKKYLKNQAEGDIETVRSKRTMSLDWRQDRYMPYKERTYKQDFGAADVFYLIDNSGSMWGAGYGEGIFLQIFSEILSIEKSCNIEKSALTYFSGHNVLPTDLIRLWDKKTSKEKILNMIGQTSKDNSGGTDIGGNIIAVTKLKKPYYYNNGLKHTLLIVFTDGEDSAQYNQIKKLPGRIKSDLLFCLINQKSRILDCMLQLHTISGIKLSNIIAICTDEYKR